VPLPGTSWVPEGTYYKDFHTDLIILLSGQRLDSLYHCMQKRLSAMGKYVRNRKRNVDFVSASKYKIMDLKQVQLSNEFQGR